MEPAVITALATFFTAMNGWTLGTIIICIFLVPPFLAMVAVTRVIGTMVSLKDEIRAKNEQDNKRFEAIVAQFNRQFEAIVAMHNQQFSEFSNKYDNNIYFVKSWEKTAGDLTDITLMSTQAATQVAERLKQLIDLLNADRLGRQS